MKIRRSFEWWLIALTVTYLATPILVFFLTWLTPLVGIPAATLLALGVWKSLSGIPDNPADSNWRTRSMTIAGAALVAYAWASLSGTGGHSYMNWDHLKHEGILKDLVFNMWPVRYELPDKTVGLNYYVAFYLLPAIGGKALGWNAANHLLFGYAFLGAFLSLLWFMVLAGRFSIVLAVLFVFFSGQDIAGYLIHNGRIPAESTEMLDWWAWGLCQYSSNTTMLCWVPQQAIAGWLATALVMHSAIQLRSSHSILFFWSLTALWSPFVTIGLLPFVGLGFCATRGESALSFQNFGAAPAVLLIVMLYFMSNVHHATSGFIWNAPNLPQHWPLLLLLFYMIEFGAFAALSFSLQRPFSGRERIDQDSPALPSEWCWACVVLLLLLPVYRLGAYNDLTMRASIPALFVLAVMVARRLATAHAFTFRIAALCVLVFIGSITACFEFQRAWNNMAFHFWIREAHTIDSVPEMPAEFRTQYEGDTSSFFYKYLAANWRN
jgi:hypothetical protein